MASPRVGRYALAWCLLFGTTALAAGGQETVPRAGIRELVRGEIARLSDSMGQEGSDEAGVRLQRAELYLSLGETAPGLADLDRYVELRGDGNAYETRAYYLLSLGLEERALDDFASAIALDPEDWYFYVRRGAYRFARLGHGDAMADYDRAVAVQPGNPQPYVERAGHHGEIGDVQAGLADFDTALGLVPFEETYGKGRTAPGSPRPRQTHTVASVLRQRSSWLEKYGDPSQALADFRRAVSIERRSPSDELRMSRLLEATGQRAAAEEILVRLVAEPPSGARVAAADLELARLVYQRGRFREALDRLEAVRQDGQVGLVRVAALYSQLGEYESAVSVCDEEIERDRLSHFAYFRKAIALRQLGRRDEAMRAIEMAIALSPYQAGYVGERVALEMELGRWAAAAADIDRTLELYPRWWYGYFLRAQKLFLQGSYGEARQEIERAVDLGRAELNASSWNTVGEVRRLSGDLAGAARAYERAVQLDRVHGFAYYNLGYTYFLMKRPYLSVRAYLLGFLRDRDALVAIRSLKLEDVLTGRF